MTAPTEFWIRCRTCDGDGPHGWVCLPTLSTRGRWAAEHKAETGHEAWQLHNGTMGELTANLQAHIAALGRQNIRLFDALLAANR